MNQKKESTQQTKNLNHVIKIDEDQIHSHLDEMVRDTVEETINKMLDAEADRLCNAQRYEHTESRADPWPFYMLITMMSAGARLRHIAGTKWSTYRYLNMKRLKDQRTEQEQELMEVAG